jgi:hypothetical protein
VYDDSIQRCRCLPGRTLVGGQCLSPTLAATYCGPGYKLENGACSQAACRPGDELDHASGMCIPHEQVNQVARDMGVTVGAGQKLGCPPGQKLVLDGPNAACVPLAQTCAPDEAFDGRACVKLAKSCPEGAAWDEAQGRCVEFAKQSPEKGLAVDVGQWAFANFGPDGGNGTLRFCNAFTKKPWAFGVNEGSSALLRVAVKLTFPDAQIAKGTVATTTMFAAHSTPVVPRGAKEVDTAARPSWPRCSSKEGVRRRRA